MDENRNERAEGKKSGTKGLLSRVAGGVSKAAAAGTGYAQNGLEIAKKGALTAKGHLTEVAGNVAKTGKEAQKAFLQYVDKKKNARFLSAKLQSFEDGIKEGKLEAVDYVKKYANFCMAATAVSFYFARCDGDITEEEQLEIQFDLDSIIKNRDLPDEIRNRLAEISLNRELRFEEVAGYLDGVSVETVLEFQKDIDEIIFADGTVNDSEKAAKQEFDEYLKRRLEKRENE
ncbi:MAG: hypothetical protein K6F53_12285 [Lachnospiraceae bacterium]|nr:hypothetical protein [Lachnospiraceae bacterium]